MNKTDWTLITVALLCITVCVTCSCVTSEKYKVAAEKTGTGLTKYEDESTICYVYKDSDKWGSLSCVKKGKK
jgi:hypothetical protein